RSELPAPRCRADRRCPRGPEQVPQDLLRYRQFPGWNPWSPQPELPDLLRGWLAPGWVLWAGWVLLSERRSPPRAFDRPESELSPRDRKPGPGPCSRQYLQRRPDTPYLVCPRCTVRC